jgi:NAD(P) transhydrogenase subunit alpha
MRLMLVGVPKETAAGERRVALTPACLPALEAAGIEVVVERGAGQAAGYGDAQFIDHGARIVDLRAEVFQAASIVTQVQCAGANRDAGLADLEWLRAGQTLIGYCDPLGAPHVAQQVAARGVTQLAMELIPRSSRAQGMDALSSMATVAGYKAVLEAAAHLPKLFPLLMTAAGTLPAARVLVLGAGVAGLQAIATARRLGAIVRAYDVRPVAREQVESLGAVFLDLPLEALPAQDDQGYARPLDEATLVRQRELLSSAARAHDVIITTAAVPGKPAPVLITADMIRSMPPGSVVVDLAADRGGNCELSRPGQTVVANGVTILAPLNLPAAVASDASRLYGRNVANLLVYLKGLGDWQNATHDEIVRETMVSAGGQVVHPLVLAALRSDSP